MTSYEAFILLLLSAVKGLLSWIVLHAAPVCRERMHCLRASRAVEVTPLLGRSCVARCVTSHECQKYLWPVVSLGSTEACIPGHDRHQGRVRSFPHVEGHYPTHVYITGAAFATVALNKKYTLVPICSKQSELGACSHASPACQAAAGGHPAKVCRANIGAATRQGQCSTTRKGPLRCCLPVHMHGSACHDCPW